MASYFKPGIKLDPTLPWKVEQREIQMFGRPVRKYAVCHEGQEWLLSSVTDVLSKSLGKGEQLMKWSVDETLIDIMAAFTPGNETIEQHYDAITAIKEYIKILIAEAGGKKNWTFSQLATKVGYNFGPAAPPENFGWPKMGEICERATKARYRTMEKAAELGTRAHELIERWVSNGGTFEHYYQGELCTTDITQEPYEVQNAFEAFLQFWDAWEFEHHSAETRLFDVTLGTGGTCDAVVRDKQGDLVMLDWKTSTGVYSNHLIQVAAYGRMHEKMGLGKCKRGYVIRFDKETAKVQIVPVWRDHVEYIDVCKQWGRCVATMHFLDWGEKYLKDLKSSVVFPEDEQGQPVIVKPGKPPRAPRATKTAQ